MMRKTILRLFLIITILISGCINQTSIVNLSEVNGVSVIVRDHWNMNNTNDGKIIYTPLLNSRNEILSGRLENLTINIALKGFDNSENYSIILFNKTYENVSYENIDFPDYPEYKKGFVIYYDEIKNYENYTTIGVFVRVMLPDERIVKTPEIEPYALL